MLISALQDDDAAVVQASAKALPNSHAPATPLLTAEDGR